MAGCWHAWNSRPFRGCRVKNDHALMFAKNFISEQAAALQQVVSVVGDSFAEAVEVISSRCGSDRLLCGGVGKAGHIARKNAATFSSVGIPAYFIHPADTGHGDFGSVGKKDIFLLYSHGGETREICQILEYFAYSEVKTILITSSQESTAARRSSLVLSYGAVAEAGPYGLAPTTSTTIMLVMGDALALACAHHIGMTPKDFARNHPNGLLGRSLLGITEVMRSGERCCLVNKTLTTRDVIKKYQNTRDRPGAAIVVDEGGLLLGVFTDGNLRRSVVDGVEFLDKPVGEVMTPHPLTVQSDKSVTDALDVLTARKVDQVVVIDNTGVAVGIVDIQDLIHLM
jgi:arabinose-5-phosphate isomerase